MNKKRLTTSTIGVVNLILVASQLNKTRLFKQIGAFAHPQYTSACTLNNGRRDSIFSVRNYFSQEVYY